MEKSQHVDRKWICKLAKGKLAQSPITNVMYELGMGKIQMHPKVLRTYKNVPSFLWRKTLSYIAVTVPECQVTSSFLKHGIIT